VFLFYCFFSPGSKGAEIQPRLGTGLNPTSLCFLRIYDSTVLLHPQIFQHFSPASWANLLFIYFLSANQLLLKERTHNIHFVVFLLALLLFFLPNQKSSVGWHGGRSVGYFTKEKAIMGLFLCFCVWVESTQELGCI